MMLDAVTFDLGCARSPLFVFPDVSGLSPLTLPDGLRQGQDHQPQPEIPSDTVRRFETAMSAEPQLPPSVVESLMAHMISGSPKVEGRKAAADEVVQESSVARPVDERPVVVSPEQPKTQVITKPAEPTVVIEKTPVLSAERPVVATVERPEVASADKPAVSLTERPTVATVEVPTVVTVEKPVVVVPTARISGVPAIVENLNSRVKAEEPPVIASSTPIAPVTKPVAMVETPVVFDKPLGTSGERPVRVDVEGSSVALTNTTIQEGSVERSAAERQVVESPKQPTIQVIATTPEEPIVIFKEPPTISADKPVASAVEAPKVVIVERPEAQVIEVPKVVTVERPEVPVVDAPKVVTVERPVVSSAVEAPKVVLVERPEVPVVDAPKVVTVERPVVSSAVEAPKVVIVERSEVPVVEAPKVVVVERPVVSAVEAPKVVLVERPEVPVVEAPKVVVVERPVVSAVEAPKIVTVERPVVVATDNPTIVTIERPVVPPLTPTVVPAVVENLNSRVAAKEQPVAVGSIPTTPVAPFAKPVLIVEMPVAVDKPVSALVEQAVEGPAVVTANRVIPESSVARPVDEKPVAASPEPPKRQAIAATPAEPTVVVEKTFVQAADKPVVSVVEKPTAVTVEVPTVATTGKPVTVAPQAAPTAAPVILENPVNRVEAEGRPVVASSIQTTPATPSAKPAASVEAPVIAMPAESTVIIEKTPVVPAERPVAAKVSNPTVAAVDKPEEKAVAAAAHVVVAPVAVEASVPQALQAAPEVAAASAASARTEVIVETVNQVVEAVVGQILVTPGITHGECEIKIMLKPTVLDGSEVTMSAKDGTLTVNITPATQEASVAAASALPRLEIALAEHAPAFHHVSVALQSKKGNRNEAV